MTDSQKYQQAWRELHPHYSRDYRRRTLGSKPRKTKPVILGVRIRTDLLRQRLESAAA